MWFSHILALGALVAAANALPKTFGRNNVQFDAVYHDNVHDVQLSFKNNSGVCETTEGVNTYSGYLDVAENSHMFFWFFEARNNPETAPLAAWFNGGPGCSSLIGLFQENGPCQFYDGSDEPSLNPYSWNEFANMVYIDSPIGAGFSYGDDPVDSTDEAAEYVWKFLQAWYQSFPEYESRDFGLFTESYGGHYGPAFTYYIEQQNAGIDDGTIDGEKIDLIALGVNNGWYSVGIQTQGYIEYMYNNPYRRLITESEYNSYLDEWESDCVPAAAKCTSTSGDEQVSACKSADRICSNATPNGDTSFDVYDIRTDAEGYVEVPETYVDYLNREDIMDAIGAMSTYSECSNSAGGQISATGDDARNYLPDMSSVVQSGIQVVMWAGDADWICNYVGNYEVAQQVEFDEQAAFRAADPGPYTVNGTEAGLFKTAGNLSWLQVYESGHEVPFYQPEAALQVFKQTMSKEVLSST